MDNSIASRLYYLADINVISLNRNVIFTASPSKTSNCIFARRPILGILDKNSKYANMLEQNNLGLVANPYDFVMICNTLERLRLEFEKYTGNYLNNYEKAKNLLVWGDLMKKIEGHLVK